MLHTQWKNDGWDSIANTYCATILSWLSLLFSFRQIFQSCWRWWGWWFSAGEASFYLVLLETMSQIPLNSSRKVCRKVHVSWAWWIFTKWTHLYNWPQNKTNNLTRTPENPSCSLSGTAHLSLRWLRVVIILTFKAMDGVLQAFVPFIS